MLTDEQKKKTKKILLMPIECITQKSESIFKHDDRIFSSQKYTGCYDPDMSDFAVEFYKIIYSEILEGSKYEFLDKKNLEYFCGDTMNSYKNIAKRIDSSEAQKWENEYHCLANFWLLPKHVGHSSSYTAKFGLMKYSKSKRGIYDYVDIFLENYLNKYEEYEKHFAIYTEKFPKEYIGDKHFLEGIYCNGEKVIPFSNNIITINDIRKKLKKRAENIICKKGTELYELFFKFHLIK